MGEISHRDSELTLKMRSWRLDSQNWWHKRGMGGIKISQAEWKFLQAGLHPQLLSLWAREVMGSERGWPGHLGPFPSLCPTAADMGGGAVLGNQTQDLTAFCCNPLNSLKVSLFTIPLKSLWSSNFLSSSEGMGTCHFEAGPLSTSGSCGTCIP